MADINLNSESSCRKAYINYYCYDNSMGLTSSDRGAIAAKWSDKFASWKTYMSTDTNAYEIDDSDFLNAKNEGKEKAKETSGSDGKNSGLDTGSNALLGAGGAVWNAASGGVSKVTNVSKITSKSSLSSYKADVTTKVDGKSVTNTEYGSKAKLEKTEGVKENTIAKNNTDKNGNKADTSTYIQAAMAIATAALYAIERPNKDEVDSLKKLQPELEAAGSTLETTQAEIEDTVAEADELADEALTRAADIQEEMDDTQSMNEVFSASFEKIQKKIDKGEKLTKSEQSLYKNSYKNMQSNNESISDLNDEKTDTLETNVDNIGELQDNFNYAQETMAEVEGMTDFAAGYDTKTKTLCYVEAVGQGMNAASGAMAGGKLMGMGPWNWALGIASIAAGVVSGLGVAEQIKLAGTAGNEIDTRKAVQATNVETNAVYTENLDYYVATAEESTDYEIVDSDELITTADFDRNYKKSGTTKEKSENSSVSANKKKETE